MFFDMKTTIIKENINRVSGIVGNVCADLNLNPNATIGDFIVAVDGGKKADGSAWPASFIACVIYAKKGKTLGSDIVDLVKKGAKVTINGYIENRNYEKQDGTKIYGNRVVVTDIHEASLFTARFTGRIFGEPFFDEKGRANFLLSGYAGKKADGTFRESPVIRVETVKAADKDIIANGNQVVVSGFLKTFESEKSGSKRQVMVINALKVEEPRELELTYDDDNNLVSVVPVVDDLP